MSVQIMLVLPKVSAAGSFLTIALCLAIFWTPMASVRVIIAGSPSGMTETARLIESMNISRGSLPVAKEKPNSMIVIATTAMAMILLKWSSFFCNGVGLVFSV